MSDWRVLPLPPAAFTSASTFRELFGQIYEHSEWVAATLWPTAASGNMGSWGAIADAMRLVVDNASRHEQLELLRAHPELASKAALAGEIAAHSRVEQSGAGLNECSSEELQSLRNLNRAYRERFGFPFIVAVTGLSREDILREMERRMSADPLDERQEALRQVHKIAAVRFEKLARSFEEPK